MIIYQKGKLFFGGKNVENLAKKLGTPFFLFSEAALRDNYRNFKKYFSSHYKNIRIDYSVKTDYEQSVLKILKEEGSSAEVVASFELQLLKKAGFSPSQVVFDGPCKTDTEIEYCLNEGIHAFYADSAGELDRINFIAGRLGKKARVGVRVNLGLKTGLPDIAYRFVSKFGIELKEAEAALKNPIRFPNLEIIALSTHMGSQILSPQKYLKACDVLTALANRLKRYGLGITEINLGGGYPSPTLIKVTPVSFLLSNFGLRQEQKVVSLRKFGGEISKRFAKRVKEYGLGKITLAFQPGRSISSSIGIAVTKVWVVKRGWAFVDVSTSSIPESILFAQRRIIPVVKKPERAKKHYSIAGKGLNSVDNFTMNESFPEIKKGDFMAVLDAGAYSISKANRYSILNPPIFMIRQNGKVEMVRREETCKDVLGPMEF